MATAQTPMSLQDYGNAISAGVREAYINTYKQEEPRLELVANVGSLEDYNQLEANFAGLGEYELTGEAEAYKEDAMLEGFTTTYTPIKFTKRVPITEELMTFDKAGIASKAKIGAALATRAANAIEVAMANVFVRGFNTSYTSYSDGKPLFSTNHTRVDNGAAFSNASSTSLPLNHDNLAFAIQSMVETLDDRGVSSSFTPRTLLVPPALEAQALEIVKSSGRSDTAERADNVFSMKEYTGGTLKVVVWTKLGAAAGGSDTAWFLLSGTDEGVGLQWKWPKGWKPQIALEDRSDENKNGVISFVGKFMYAVGWGNPRGTWGSKGDATTYTS